MIRPTKTQILAIAIALPMLAATVALAGYQLGRAGQPAPEVQSQGSDTAYQFGGGYTWSPPVVTDGAGNVLVDHPLLADPAAVPHVVEQLVDGGGAEPTIGITSNGHLFVVTFDQVRRSTDHGKSWHVVWDFVTPNYPVTIDRYSTLDPLLYVDPDTDRIYVSHLTGWSVPVVGMLTYCTNLAFSDDDGDTWTNATLAPSLSCDIPILLDHQKMGTANYRASTALNPTTLVGEYSKVFYYCVNRHAIVANVATFCAVSYDGGQTFAHTRELRQPGYDDLFQGACPGINGQPAAYPDGTVVVPICGGFYNTHSPIVAVTEDNGLTWRTSEFDGDIGQVEIDPDIAITPDGTAYLLFRGKDQLSYLLRSRDKFQTWDGPFKVALPDQTLNAFSAIVAGADGRIALAYLGTSTTQLTDRELALPPEDRPSVEPSYAVRGTLWHLYVATSSDALSDNPTFLTVQVTPAEDPVQVGCIWMYGSPGLGDPFCRNLLDFIDMQADKDGRYYVAFTDGCTPRNGCTTDPEAGVAHDSTLDRQVGVAVLDSGPGLWSAALLPSLGFQHPPPQPPEGSGET